MNVAHKDQSEFSLAEREGLAPAPRRLFSRVARRSFRSRIVSRSET
jgi:hypothetical protein